MAIKYTPAIMIIPALINVIKQRMELFTLPWYPYLALQITTLLHELNPFRVKFWNKQRIQIANKFPRVLAHTV